jgi:DNA-binding CsgD family transcriptional regulator
MLKVERRVDESEAALVGRTPDLQVIRSFLKRSSQDGDALIVRGEPGVGKTALLRVADELASGEGALVLRAAGVQFEADVAYSTLNQALLPLHGGLPQLSDASRDALTAALGFSDREPLDRLVVSNAAHALIRTAEPVVLIVDDLHWVDRASAAVLGFIARRLGGTRIGFLASVRVGEESFFDRGGIPEHDLRPLAERDAARLLATRFPALTARVRQRLLFEAQGNPLALIELAGTLGDDVARASLPAVFPLPRRLQGLYASQVEALPAATRELLLLAALDGTGDTRILGAGRDGRGVGDLTPAEQGRLAHIDPTTHRLSFRHPLIRSAVVDLAQPAERRQAHEALAELWRDDPDRRAWHLGEAAIVPDEAVALLLEESARRIRRRGDATGAATTLLRAADLSPSGCDRARRLAEAAYIGAEESGELQTASLLLSDARRADPQLRTSLHAASAAVFLLINGDGDVDTAHRLLVGAIETGNHGYAADDSALVEALHSLLLVCWFGSRPELWEPFYAMLARLTPEPPVLLSVLTRTFADPVRTAAAALDDFNALVADLPVEDDPTRIMRIGTASVYVDRLADSRERAWRLVKQGRSGGPARRHLGSLMHLCLDDFLTGRWSESHELAEEGLVVCARHGYRFFEWYFHYNKAIVEAARGDFDDSRASADAITRWAVPRGVRSAQLFAHHPRVLAAAGEGDFEAAYRHAVELSPAGTLVSHVPHALWVAFDLVEAALHIDRRAEARAHAEAMRRANLASISNRLALLQYGSAALTAESGAAADLFELALATPGAAHWQWDYARVQLAYGEYLRRERTMIAARAQLTSALEAFDRLGATPWTARAAAELRATGRTKPRAGEYAAASLTPQEQEIARLAAQGLTNKQIGEKLFLSHRTIGNHLHRVFPKLGITSRAALRDALQAYAASSESRR